MGQVSVAPQVGGLMLCTDDVVVPSVNTSVWLPEKVRGKKIIGAACFFDASSQGSWYNVAIEKRKDGQWVQYQVGLNQGSFPITVNETTGEIRVSHWYYIARSSVIVYEE